MFYLRNQTKVRIFAETKKQYAMMSREETYQLKYTIALIAEFAFEEAIRDISIICFRNGGKLQYQDL